MVQESLKEGTNKTPRQMASIALGATQEPAEMMPALLQSFHLRKLEAFVASIAACSAACEPVAKKLAARSLPWVVVSPQKSQAAVKAIQSGEFSAFQLTAW